MSAQLHLLGAVGTVTGSSFLLDGGDVSVLVDCGLRQDARFCDDCNYEPFSFDPRTLGTLLVTHAHLDHIGRIPRLVAQGFRGPIISTGPTRDIAALLFDDALTIMAYEEQEHGREPLYGKEDVAQALSQWRVHNYHETIPVGNGATVRMLDSGHILGSAMMELTRSGRKIVFTGDLGNSPAPVLRDTEPLPSVHYLVMESVYGDRLHTGREHRRERLRELIEENRRKGGVLLIPAFSVQRTQVLLYELNAMVEDGSLAPFDLYLDSPLAIKVTDVYRNYPQYFNDDARARLQHDDIFSFPGLSVTPTVAESDQIARAPRPKVIMAAAGMSVGGRILAHEREYLEDSNTTIVFPGYQTVGSLGRRIQDGQKRVRVGDQWVRVRAKTEILSGYSAHKDRDELVAFVEPAADSLERVFVAMGEPKSSNFLAQRLRDFLGVDAVVPRQGDNANIDW